MTINRLNYEKYAIDYLDGTLSTDLREEMMAFLNAHPDIREEVEWQQQFTAPALTAISHPDKSKLLKSEPVIRQLKPIYWIAAAASVLMLIAFGLFWKPQQDNHPMASGDKQIAPASEASKQIAEQQEEPGQQIAETPTFKQDLVESPAATISAESNPIKQQDLSSPKTKPRRSSVQVAQHSTDLPSIPETPNRESESVITDQPDREIALLCDQAVDVGFETGKLQIELAHELQVADDRSIEPLAGDQQRNPRRVGRHQHRGHPLLQFVDRNALDLPVRHPRKSVGRPHCRHHIREVHLGGQASDIVVLVKVVDQRAQVFQTDPLITRIAGDELRHHAP